MKRPKYLEEISKDLTPDRFGITFSTNSKNYFYDRGTNKVIECKKWEQNFIFDLLQGHSLQEIEDKVLATGIEDKQLERFYSEIEYENLLKAPVYSKINSLSVEELKEGVNGLSQLILELTEKCNLRCKYCIYNEGYQQFRNFDYKSMSWDTAKKSIDYACLHSGDEVSITFYGGEPLLNYDVLKKSIEYSISSMPDKKLSFSFTTNLTLMTKDKAEFFASQDNIYILCSFDGPKDIHDKFRIGVDGQGSFDKAISGLKCLIEAFGDRSKECIGINAVICPPFCFEKYEKVMRFFRNLNWLSDECQINYVYVSGGTLNLTDVEKRDIDKESEKYTYELIQDWQFSYRNDEDMSQMVDQYIKTDLRRIHERLITSKPIEVLPCNGCCIPGRRRLYITVSGEFQICEKMGKSIPLGNIENGINIEQVYEKYIKEYEDKSLPECSKCWASALCGLCYIMAYDEKGINMEKKRISCLGQKAAALDNLRKYHILLEEQPERIRRLFANKE